MHTFVFLCCFIFRIAFLY